MIRRMIGFVMCMFMTSFLLYGQQDKAKWSPKLKYPVLDELEAELKAERAEQDSITEGIRARQKKKVDAEEEAEQKFVAEYTNIQKPESPDVFTKYFAFPPVAQYQSGMCWCFSTTSYLESEIYRLHKKEIKLSELYTVYWEYVEKARRFIRERGDSYFAEGSESNAVFRIMKQYGAVPAEVYTGLINDATRHNHTALIEKMEAYLKYCKENNFWNEETALESIKLILNEHIGQPPSEFSYDGKEYTPQNFLKKVLKLKLDDYVDLMSTSSIPFYTQGIFDVPDNWWLDSSYYNIPLDEWCSVIQKAMERGYTICIGGDVSEPGYFGPEDAAFVPSFDIPQEYINQDSREYRIQNGSTEDDHGIHMIGYTKVGDYNWYLIKDSARGSRQGKYEGYYMYREDYPKLKMLGFSVHKDIVKDILKKFD
ncbi:C1 family peptidase [bacterium]|nr:C1 family peptidase [bacterium]MBU1634763.1 C1 family peptidase [bacterium]MBU1873729.1 C1 family peptidase [bacterium]